jgi:hypothetical protein
LLTKFSLRLFALVVVAVIVAPAITECTAWAILARHACCANRDGLPSETSMTSCCGMSQQSTDSTLPDAQSIRAALKPVAQPVTSPVDLPGFHTVRRLDSVVARPATVPLYLQQASLLI